METYIIYAILLLSGIGVGLLFALSRHNDAYYHNSRYLGNPYNPYRRYQNSGFFTTLFAAILIGALFFAHYSKEEQKMPKSEGRGVSTSYKPSAHERALNEVALEVEGRREPLEQDEPKEPVYAAMNMFPGGSTSRPTVKPALKPEPRHPSSVYIQRMALSNYIAAREKAAELTAETGVTHYLGIDSELHSGAYKLLIGPFIDDSEAEGYLQHIGGEGFVFDNARYGLSVEAPKRLVY